MENEKPLVAVHCLVYNHEPFLRDCFEGFLIQKTNFPFVAIVHDDASTDESAAIIREYEEKYPHIFKPIYEVENQYSKLDGSLERIMHDAIDAIEAKYVAMCEGDDYWTDPLKLQKQVDFLENHIEYTLCYTDYTNVDEHNKSITWSNRQKNIKRSITGDNFAELLKGNYIQTCTMLFKKNIYEEKDFIGNLDYALSLQCALLGKCVFIPQQMSNYRIQSNSIIHTQYDHIQKLSQEIWLKFSERYNSEKRYHRRGFPHIKIMSIITYRLWSILISGTDEEKRKTKRKESSNGQGRKYEKEK